MLCWPRGLQISSQPAVCIFVLFIGKFARIKVLILMRSSLSIFPLMDSVGRNLSTLLFSNYILAVLYNIQYFCKQCEHFFLGIPGAQMHSSNKWPWWLRVWIHTYTCSHWIKMAAILLCLQYIISVLPGSHCNIKINILKIKYMRHMPRRFLVSLSNFKYFGKTV